jgi:hypothetical protein
MAASSASKLNGVTPSRLSIAPSLSSCGVGSAAARDSAVDIEALLARADAVCGALLDCSEEERLLNEYEEERGQVKRDLQSKKQETRDTIAVMCEHTQLFRDATETHPAAALQERQVALVAEQEVHAETIRALDGSIESTQARVAQVASESASLRAAQQSAEAQAEQRRKAKGGMGMMAQLYADGTNIVWNYDETTSVLAEQEQTKRVAAGTFHFTQPSLQLRPFRIEIDTQRNKQANFEAANKLWAQMDAHWDAADAVSAAASAPSAAAAAADDAENIAVQ